MITLRQFYTNPTGGSASAYSIGAARYAFEYRYGGVTKKLKKKFYVKIFTESPMSYWFHILVPSDNRKIHYDVVIHFYENVKNPEDTHISLKDWNVQFFSNCPSFVYTYAYAYKKAGLLIESLEDKLGGAATTAADEKNPGNHIMWDVSIYYAIHHLFQEARFTQRYLVRRDAKEWKSDDFISSIRTFDDILKLIEENDKMTKSEFTKKIRGEKPKKKSITDTIKGGVRRIVGGSNKVKKITGKKR